MFIQLSTLHMDNQLAKHCTVLCKLVVSLQMQNRKTTDKINEISIVPNPPNYSIVAIANQRALHLHFATDNQLAKPCIAYSPAFLHSNNKGHSTSMLHISASLG